MTNTTPNRWDERMRQLAPREHALQMIQPYRKGTRVYVVINGDEIDLHPVAVGLMAEAWNRALSGAYYAATVKVPENEDELR